MKFIKPVYRYLLYILASFFRRLLHYIPRKTALALGKAGGDICYITLAAERRRALSHLRAAFKGDNRDAGRIARNVFRHLGMNLAEWMQISRIDINSVVKSANLHIIDRELAKGRGIILITPHLGNWEYMAAYFVSRGYKGAVVAREIYYSGYNKILSEMRQSAGFDVIYRNGSVRNMLRTLRRNGILALLPDQDTKKVDGVFVDFFGRPAYTPSGPAVLALASGAPIVPCFIVREGYRHHIYVEKPIYIDYAASREETIRINTKRWSDIFERYIRKYPSQWVWMHRRWKRGLKNI